MKHRTPGRARVGIIVGTGFALGLIGAAPVARGEGALPDWKSLQQSVLELDVYSPGTTEPVKGVGFFLEGTEGLVTSHRLVKGASRVVAHRGANSIEITRYLARDAKTDIVLLEVTPPGPKLGRSSYLMAPMQQTVFYIVPASSATPVQGMVMRVFEGAGIGEMLAVSQHAPQGAPVADSLGRVLAMIEPLGTTETPAVCAIPVERVMQVAALPDRGGTLASLASDPTPPWVSADTAEGLQVLGAFYSRAERFDTAVSLLTRATEKNPRLVEAWMEWGMALQLKDLNADAEVKYRKAIELQPGNARARLYFGSCLFNEEMLLQAQEQYDAALKANPDFAQAYVNLAGVYFRQEKKDDAERALQHAADMQPLLGIAHYNLGALYASQGRTAAALGKFDLLRKERSGYAGQLRHLMTAK